MKENLREEKENVDRKSNENLAAAYNILRDFSDDERTDEVRVVLADQSPRQPGDNDFPLIHRLADAQPALRLAEDKARRRRREHPRSVWNLTTSGSSIGPSLGRIDSNGNFLFRPETIQLSPSYVEAKREP